MKKELIDFLDEVMDSNETPRRLRLWAYELKCKSINSDALSESPDVNEHEQAKEVCQCKVCYMTFSNYASLWFHYEHNHNKHKTKIE